jgi:hypothetical protein
MKRAGKGNAREEQRFFDDPAVDGLMGVLMALATEHYVLRDRVRLLEQRLPHSGHIEAGEAASADEDAAAFVAELMRPLLGLQDSVGIGGRFSLKSSRRRIRS